jgi:PAS domain S-box-containing protein
MNKALLLMLEAMIMYLLVLGAHSLRRRFGPVHFYALLGGITAIMSWVTDAGLAVQMGGITFVVGSTVFYTSLLLGIFVVYVFDGPKITRIAISTVVGVSILMPVIAAAIHYQMDLIGATGPVTVPLPSLRINTASVVATLLDLIFLAVAWEFLGTRKFRVDLWFRTWLTLLGVMWLDVLLFATGAFAGTPSYLNIMQGTLISRFIISLFALPFLYGYLYWQSRLPGVELKNRPVLAILKRVVEMEEELTTAQQEIARRKQAEEALRASEERFRRAIVDAPFPIMIHAEDGQVVRINRMWTELTGYGAASLPTVGAWIALAFGTEPARTQAETDIATSFARDAVVTSGEQEIRTRDGETRVWELSSALLGRLADGRRLMITMAADVTQRKGLEAELAHAQKMEAIGRLAGGIAHDFNNQLTGIIGYASLLLEEMNPVDPRAQDVRQIRRAAEHSATLTRQLLTFSRKQKIRPQSLVMNRLISNMQEMLQRLTGEGVTMTFRLSTDLGRIKVDPGQMEQVVMNLVLNARDAIREKAAHDDHFEGVLLVETANVSVETPNGDGADALAPGDYVMLAVRDNGVGMDAETQAHLFEPFFTTKAMGEGTGLGLATVYGIVKRSGGDIVVESETKVGSAFRVYFPRLDQRPEHISSHAMPERIWDGGE